MERELGNQIFFEDGDIKAGGDVHRDMLQRRLMELKKEGRPSEAEIEALKTSGMTASILLALSTTSLGGAMTAFVTWVTVTEDDISQALCAAWIVLTAIAVGFGRGFYKYGYNQRLEDKISTRSEVEQPSTNTT